MRLDRRVFGIAVLFAIFGWIADAGIDALFFYDTSFWSMLVTDVPLHEIYIRSMIVGSYLLFGIIASYLVQQRSDHQKELEQANTLLETLFGALPVGVLVEDAERNVMAANQHLIDLFDISYDGEDIIERDYESVFELASNQFADPDQFQNRTSEIVERAEPVDGEEISFSNGQVYARSYRPIDLREGTGHIWLYEDITRLKEREEELSHQKATVETLHQVAMEIAAAETPEDIFELLVEAAESILDFDIAIVDEEEDGILIPKAVSSNIDASQYYDETQVDAPDNFAAESYRTGEPIVVDDLLEQSVEPADTSFRSALTVPIGEYGIFQSVSKAPNSFDERDRELVELLVSHAREQLRQLDIEEKLREQTEHLKRQNSRLEKFASIISHDLRNPLNVAQGRLELAQEECESEHLAAIQRSHDRISNLIDDVLSMARAGTQIHETTPITLSDTARKCWENVDTGQLSLSIDDQQKILADPSRLQQVFENLFRNSAENGAETVTVGSLPNGFFVADDGPGIPESERDEVFDYGYSTREAGTGIGLSIVSEIAEAHGWDVRVTESEQGGARFEFTGVATPED